MRLRRPKALPNKPLLRQDRLLIGLTGGFFLLLLLLSLVLFLSGGRWVRRTLFFPELGSGRLAGESRFLPRRRSLEGNVQLLLQEVILGPELPMHRPLLPPQTRLLAVLARQRSVYVSLSRELLTEGGGADPQDALAALGASVYFNFPRVRRLQLLIEGQVPLGWDQDYSRRPGRKLR